MNATLWLIFDADALGQNCAMYRREEDAFLAFDPDSDTQTVWEIAPDVPRRDITEDFRSDHARNAAYFATPERRPDRSASRADRQYQAMKEGV